MVRSSRPLILPAIILFALTTLITYLFFTRSKPTFLSPFAIHQLPSPSPTPTPDPLRPVNVLLLGYAGPNHDGGNLTDTLMLAHINPKLPAVTLISIPRDVWVELPLTTATSSGTKINAAWAIGNDDRKYPQKPAEYTGGTGGFNLAKYAVSQVTGLTPDYVVAVNFQGFNSIIDQLGGLTVNVPYSFDDPFYPITGLEKDPCGKAPEDIAALSATMSGEKLEREFSCRYEPLHFDAGRQSMDSETALKFVRSRHAASGGGDFNRARRQQALITALKDELTSLSNLPKLPQIAQTLKQSVTTNIDLPLISRRLTLYPKASDFNINNLTISDKTLLQESISVDKQYILIPVAGPGNFSAIHEYIQTNLTASPSAAQTP